MMNIENPIDLMPPYFKDNDTYKDGSGKGILERFLATLGSYLKTEVSLTVDNFLDTVIDIDTMDINLINFIWEYQGSIPYAYGTLLGKDVFGKTIMVEDTSDNKPRARFREVLRYAISLYRIRGTLDFYPALLRLYGYDAELRDPTGDYLLPNGNTSAGDYITKYDTEASFDGVFNYDISNQGLLCVNVTAIVTIPEEQIGDLLIYNRIYGILNLYRPAHIKPFSSSNVSFRQGGFPYTFPIVFSN